MMNPNPMAKIAIILFLGTSLTACGRSEDDSERDEPKAEAAASPATLHADFNAEQIKSSGIELAQAGPASIRETLPLYGVVTPNAERVRDVSARFAGVIRSVNRKMGDAVKQGEVLATVESNESLQTYAVIAPISGVITARNANPGEQSGEKSLFTIADLSTVWVELSLFPRDVAKVHVGQKAQLRSTDTELSTEGKVIYVAPFGQASNQTLVARVLLDNEDQRWAPGLYVKADVVTSETQLPLTIRKSAIQQINDAATVFVRTSKGFEARKVQLGRGDAETVEVIAGLKAGDSYAADNSYVVKAETMKSEAAEE